MSIEKIERVLPFECSERWETTQCYYVSIGFLSTKQGELHFSSIHFTFLSIFLLKKRLVKILGPSDIVEVWTEAKTQRLDKV